MWFWWQAEVRQMEHVPLVFNNPLFCTVSDKKAPHSPSEGQSWTLQAGAYPGEDLLRWAELDCIPEEFELSMFSLFSHGSLSNWGLRKDFAWLFCGMWKGSSEFTAVFFHPDTRCVVQVGLHCSGAPLMHSTQKPAVITRSHVCGQAPVLQCA